MASEIKVDTIVNAGGDNDTGIDLATNDQILLKVANATRLTMNSTGQTTIVGEGGTTTTSVQQGLTKAWASTTGEGTPVIRDSFNMSSISDDYQGTYTFDFTNDMSSTYYTGHGDGERDAAGEGNIVGPIDVQTGTIQFRSKTDAGNYDDLDQGHFIIHGDLA